MSRYGASVFDSIHKFILAPMEAIAFAELPDAMARPIDTGELRLPAGYEIAMEKHTLDYPRLPGGEITLDITFRVRRVRP